MRRSRNWIRFALCTVAAVLMSGMLSLPALAQSGNCVQKDNSSRPDCDRAIAFFHRVQTALRNNNRRQIAAMVNYPLQTTLGRERTRIRSRDELLAHFDQIFNPEVRCAVLATTDKDVWGNDQGFMVGNGAIWFDAILPNTPSPNPNAKYPFKIKTVNHGTEPTCKPA